MELNLKNPVLLAGLVIAGILVLSVVFSETFGAEPNPTGNPIGGGPGYSRIISPTDASVKYIVSTKDQLLTALARAQPGEVIFVPGDANIDMTGTPSAMIPAGVTLASDRGLAGSAGGLLSRTQNLNGGWEEPMFIAGGDYVRVTGLRLQGEMYPQDYGNKAGETFESDYLVGIYVENKTGFEIDNCEMYGWAWSCVSLRQNSNAPIPYMHHNYIHHNQARGEGYGINLYGGNALIEANLFDYNRHDITGAGMAGEQYEARYNRILGHGNAIGASHFDVHAYPPGQKETVDSIAGYEYKIHHNTFESTELPCIGIRALPQKGVWIEHNIFKTTYDEPPVFQRYAGTFGGMYMTRNYIGKNGAEPVLVPDEDIWYLHPPV